MGNSPVLIYATCNDSKNQFFPVSFWDETASPPQHTVGPQTSALHDGSDPHSMLPRKNTIYSGVGKHLDPPLFKQSDLAAFIEGSEAVIKKNLFPAHVKTHHKASKQ